MLLDYPRAMPPEVLDLVIQALRGNIPNKAKAIHATWNVVGYGLGQVVPDTQFMTPGAEVAAHQIEWARLKGNGVPWQNVLGELLLLLQRLLG